MDSNQGHSLCVCDWELFLWRNATDCVTMRSGSVATAQYTYVRPFISSVFPKSGPMADTNETIEGLFLNVSNGEKVLLNGAMCVIL